MIDSGIFPRVAGEGDAPRVTAYLSAGARSALCRTQPQSGAPRHQNLTRRNTLKQVQRVPYVGSIGIERNSARRLAVEG